MLTYILALLLGFKHSYDPDHLIEDLKNRSIKRFLMTEIPGDSGGGLQYRQGLLKLENIAPDKYSEFFKLQDICSFDYWVFDKISRQEVLAQYNMMIKSRIEQKGSAQKAFENEVVVILKNTNQGGDCIENGNF